MKVRLIVGFTAFALSTVWAAAPENVVIEVLSTRPEYVTGGDALVRVSGFSAAAASARKATAGKSADKRGPGYRVIAAGKDVTAAFKNGVGLVTGLPPGKSTITVETTGGKRAKAAIEITNYPITGPVLPVPGSSHSSANRTRSSCPTDRRSGRRSIAIVPLAQSYSMCIAPTARRPRSSRCREHAADRALAVTRMLCRRIWRRRPRPAARP
jgi:hypothetical protein